MSSLGILLVLVMMICSWLLAASSSAASSCSCCSDEMTNSFPSSSPSGDGGGDTLALLKDAEISNGALHLTPASGSSPANKSGAAFLPAAVTLSRVDSQGVRQDASIETSFTMTVLHYKHSPVEVTSDEAAGHKVGQRGLAFVIVPTVDCPPPGCGDGVVRGLTNTTGRATGATPSSSNSTVAVEFDFDITARQPHDPGKYNISLIAGGETLISIPGCDVKVSPQDQTIASNYTVWIVYKGGQLWVHMDLQGRPKPETACLEASLNLTKYVSTSQTQRAYIGFMASSKTTTGLNSDELHYYFILSWDLKVKFPGDGLDIDMKTILPAILGIIAVTAIMYAAVAVFYYNSKYKALKMELELTEALRRLPGTPREFKHATIRKATNNFDEARKLGNGGFGAVYRGTLRSAGAATSVVEVAVKKFTRDETRCYDDFLSEVDIINRLRHRNIVPLVGWSYEKGELLLIYQYMPNGSLDQKLFPKNNNNQGGAAGVILGWRTRYSIVMDVAAGLHYVHHEHEHMVLHRDIKASNIMLDAGFRGRLGDFGLARIVGLDKNSYTDVGVAGTWGFIAPEYSVSHKATRKTDVFAFGVLVLEIVTGKRALCVFHETFQMLTDWVWRLHREGRLLAAIDGQLISSMGEEEGEELDYAGDATRLLLLGLACTNPNPSDRPSMAEVVQVVTRSAPPPDVPLVKPAFVWPPEEGAQLELDDTTTMSDLDVNQWEEIMSSSDMPLR